MYRSYEDPYKVQKLLEEAEQELERAKQDDEIDGEALYDLEYEVQCLRDRLNFAWQDDEYDEMNASY